MDSLAKVTTRDNMSLSDSTASSQNRALSLETIIQQWFSNPLPNHYHTALTIYHELLSCEDKAFAKPMLLLAQLFLEVFLTPLGIPGVSQSTIAQQGLALLKKMEEKKWLHNENQWMITAFEDKLNEPTQAKASKHLSSEGQEISLLIQVETGKMVIVNQEILTISLNKMILGHIPEAIYLDAHARIVRRHGGDQAAKTEYAPLNDEIKDNRAALTSLLQLVITNTSPDKFNETYYRIGTLFLHAEPDAETMSDEKIAHLGYANLCYSLFLGYQNLGRHSQFNISVEEFKSAQGYFAKAFDYWGKSGCPIPGAVNDAAPIVIDDEKRTVRTYFLCGRLFYYLTAFDSVDLQLTTDEMSVLNNFLNRPILPMTTLRQLSDPYFCENPVNVMSPIMQYLQAHSITHTWLDQTKPRPNGYITNDKEKDNESALALLKSLAQIPLNEKDETSVIIKNTHYLIGMHFIRTINDPEIVRTMTPYQIGCLGAAHIHYDIFLAYHNLQDDSWFGLSLEKVNIASYFLMHAIKLWKTSGCGVPEEINKKIPVKNGSRLYQFGRHNIGGPEPLTPRMGRSPTQKKRDRAEDLKREESRRDVLACIGQIYLPEINEVDKSIDPTDFPLLINLVNKKIPEAIYINGYYRLLRDDTTVDERIALLVSLQNLGESKPQKHQPQSTYYSIGRMFLEPNSDILQHKTAYQIECLGYVRICYAILFAHATLGESVPIDYYSDHSYIYNGIIHFWEEAGDTIPQAIQENIHALYKKIQNSQGVQSAIKKQGHDTGEEKENGVEVEFTTLKYDFSSEEESL